MQLNNEHIILPHGTLKCLHRNILQDDGLFSAPFRLCKVTEEHCLKHAAGHRQHQLVALELLS